MVLENLQPKEIPAGGQKAEDHGVQHETGYGYLPVGQKKDTCKKKAEEEGAYAWDEHAQACWMIFGRTVKIEDLEHSIMEGFQIVNFNFRAVGNQPAVPTQNDLPGPVASDSRGGLIQRGYKDSEGIWHDGA